MDKISLNELSQENQNLKLKDGLIPLKVLMLSNVTIEPSEIPFKNVFFKAGFNLTITYGNYNNIINDTRNAPNYDITIVIWELANLVDDLLFKYFAYNANQKQGLIEKIKSEMDLVLANLSTSPLTLVTQFTANHFYHYSEASHAFDGLVSDLNTYLKDNAPLSAHLIAVDKVYANLGVENCIDFKMFNLFKSLYTTSFYYQLAQTICPSVCRNKGKVKKVLIMDCDNTLWNGIVGEDGFEGIDMSANSKKGSSFAKVQYLLKGLHQRGVLLCICSKNNHDDVQHILDNHPDFLLASDDFLIKKVNWISKVENIKAIAEELNLGLDSFVFVDDSDFEVNLVKEQLPEVKVYQVPKKLHLYPSLFIDILNDFYSPVLTKEDLSKTESYKQEFKRKELQSKVSNQQEYLASLELQIACDCDSFKDIERIAQMTQKTNQFNFTTKRYTNAEIEQFMNSALHSVLSYSVKDKYGDYGITAVAILNYEGADVEMDTFLMSCRIIGRDLEFAIMDNLFEHISQRNFEKLNLRLIYTKKNIVINDFADKLGFEIVEQNEMFKQYTKGIKDYNPFNLKHIKLQESLAQ